MEKKKIKINEWLGSETQIDGLLEEIGNNFDDRRIWRSKSEKFERYDRYCEWRVVCRGLGCDKVRNSRIEMVYYPEGPGKDLFWDKCISLENIQCGGIFRRGGPFREGGEKNGEVIFLFLN